MKIRYFKIFMAALLLHGTIGTGASFAAEGYRLMSEDPRVMYRYNKLDKQNGQFISVDKVRFMPATPQHSEWITMQVDMTNHHASSPLNVTLPPNFVLEVLCRPASTKNTACPFPAYQALYVGTEGKGRKLSINIRAKERAVAGKYYITVRPYYQSKSEYMKKLTLSVSLPKGFRSLRKSFEKDEKQLKPLTEDPDDLTGK